MRFCSKACLLLSFTRRFGRSYISLFFSSMTVDCSSQRSENYSILPDRQAKLKNGNNKETSKFVNDIKRKPRLEVSGVDEGEPKRKSARQDKTFNIKDDSNCGVTTRSNVKPGKRARTQTPERSLSVTPGMTH